MTTKDWAAVANKTPEQPKEPLNEVDETEGPGATGVYATDTCEPVPEDVTEPKSSPEHEAKKSAHVSKLELEKELQKAKEDAEANLAKYKRVLADLENVRRRAEQDVANAHKYSLEKFAFELLHVVDNLERTLENQPGGETHENFEQVRVGIELTHKMFLDTLQKFGITQINPQGEAFSPEQHSAMMTKEDPNTKPNTVLQVVQKGYMLKERLLRPALVIVAK